MMKPGDNVHQDCNQRKFSGGQKSLLATIMTSSICSQSLSGLFVVISLRIKREEMMINSEKRKLLHG